MEPRSNHSGRPALTRIRWLFLLLGAGILLILAGLLATVLLVLRAEMRDLVLQRDATLLTSVAQQRYEESRPILLPELDLLGLAVESSELRGVIGVRVYSPPGKLIARAPEVLFPAGLAEERIAALARGEPVTGFYPARSLDTLFRDAPADQSDAADTSALLEVVSPLRDGEGRTVAAVQFWLDGATVAREFAGLDRSLAGIGLLVLVGGGGLVIAILVLTRKRLQRMAGLLAERNRSLEKANVELARAARTSAIGSVTSHLFHGLKNPLAGLQSYLRLTSGDEEAVALTHRMQSLINETLEVIREEENGDGIYLSLEEWADVYRKRLEPEVRARPVVLSIRHEGEGELMNARGQMLLLVLRNLVENAAEAIEEEGSIEVVLAAGPEGLRATVSDNGPGLPGEVQDRLFEPVRSRKENGTGVGLAIAAVIARHIPADLRLADSGPRGTTFIIEISP
ncbi:MAG: hypothetical protein GVY10_03795 [Verrucomicrobia bacterium]|jgi:signal transduction histidine kinase|nr:hypothetical protein [Verrucomicrobiota bacterium]